MMPSDFIYLSILTPLIVFLITPLLKRFTLQRDLLGPIGGVISFFASINITNLVLDGKEVKLTLINISDGLSISFNVYPLGAIFGLVASGLWILASIYSIGYMRGNKELNQTRFFSFYAISIFQFSAEC